MVVKTVSTKTSRDVVHGAVCNWWKKPWNKPRLFHDILTTQVTSRLQDATGLFWATAKHEKGLI